MKKKNCMLLCAAALLCILFTFTSCGTKASEIKLPDEKKVKEKISQIIEDKFDDPVLISESEEDSVWETSLPERNGLKVRFTFEKVGEAKGLGNGSVAYYDYNLHTTTDYVSQIIKAFDSSLKVAVDEKYGITPFTTAFNDKLINIPCVEVHTPQTLDEFTEDKMIGYINECMELYDFKAVPCETVTIARRQGVETLCFHFIFDNVTDPNVNPFVLSIQLSESSLSAINVNGTERFEHFNESWAKQQLSDSKAKYKYKLENADGQTQTENP